MRSQMVAGKLDAAARTLQWIRKINLSGTVDASNNKAAVINAAVNPLGSNPTNFNDTSRDMVAPQWQVLEPQ